MSTIKPVLGYPSLTAAAVALKADGRSDDEIAALIGRSRQAVQTLLWSARKAKARPQRVWVSRKANERLLAAAVRRDLTPSRLMAELLEVVAVPGPDGRDLIDAVLDDQHTEQSEEAA